MLEINILMLFDLIKIPLSIGTCLRGAGGVRGQGYRCLILVWWFFIRGTGLFV